MEPLDTNRQTSLRDKLSLRMLFLVILLISYTLLAVWLGNGKLHVAALALPVGLVGLLASNSPHALSLCLSP